MKIKFAFALNLLAGLALLFVSAAASAPALSEVEAPVPMRQAEDASPPNHIVKLIFIHHSTGENWLRDDYGGLGLALGQNNYFVSDTNYGWGPDGIGDRTDIPDWVEWFASDSTPRYMDALFDEGGRHSDYTRTLDDPGGENEIILFKSCFPNSALEGNPNDPPNPEGWLSVGHAKYVYGEILRYFATRPDKLFVVITAPPLSDPAYAANARAFNEWLVNDWLSENNYTLNNVAVFDFYNVLTGADNHHRFVGGQVEHVFTPGTNTLFYPSDDDHPSAAGSRKATEEFIPLLNVFYHRWQADAPLQPSPALASPMPEAGTQPQPSALIDDFESGAPAGTNGWEPFWDEATPTSMYCAAESGTAHGGNNSLLLDFDVAANAWATCALFYEETPQNWSESEGLTFYLHAAEAGLVFDVDIYAGSRDAQETYIYTLEAPPESANGWVPIELHWSDFHRADWEENSGASFDNPGRVVGLAFGFTTYPDTPNTGTLWVDDIKLVGGQSTVIEPPQAQPTLSQPEGEDGEQNPRRLLPCRGAVFLPLAVALWAWGKRRK